jgi:hypothetical protein
MPPPFAGWGEKKGPPAVGGPSWIGDASAGAIVSSAIRYVGIGISAGALRNDTTPGISQFSHISSTLAWKYARSSSVKCAKRPCFRRYSRTGFR